MTNEEMLAIKLKHWDLAPPFKGSVSSPFYAKSKGKTPYRCGDRQIITLLIIHYNIKNLEKI